MAKANISAVVEWPTANYAVERWFGTQKITWKVSDTREGFRHWLEGPGGERSEWHSGYSFMATLRVGDKLYAACTAYMEGTLPSEQPFQVIEGRPL